MAADDRLGLRINEADKRALAELAATDGRSMSELIKIWIQREIGRREALTQSAQAA